METRCNFKHANHTPSPKHAPPLGSCFKGSAMYSVVFSACLYVSGLQIQVLNEMTSDDIIRLSEESFPRVTSNLIVQRYFTLLHMENLL